MIMKLKQFTTLMVVCAFLMLSSCEKDLYDEAIQKDKNILVKNISLSKLSRKNNAKLFSSVDEVRNKKKNVQGKIVYDSINDIYFDDENGKYIEREDGYKSYTFPIIKFGNGDKKIENIVFSLNEMGEYDVYKAQYDFTKEEKENLTEQEIAMHNVIYTEITQGKLGQIVCIVNMVWQQASTNLHGIPTQAPNYHWEWVATSYHCYHMADNTGGFAGGGGDTDGPIDAPSNSGTSGGQSGGGSISTTPIALTPTQEGMAAFMHDFTDRQLDWYNNQSEATLNAITNYLVQNGFSPESKSFIKQIITACTINGSTFIIDSNVNSSNAQVFNNLSDYTNYINANSITPSFESFDPPTDSNSHKVYFKFKITMLSGVTVIAQVVDDANGNSSISSVTSVENGIYVMSEWVQQGEASITTFPNGNVKITVVGSVKSNAVIEAVGIKSVSTFELIAIYNPNNGIIISTSCIKI